MTFGITHSIILIISIVIYILPRLALVQSIIYRKIGIEAILLIKSRDTSQRTAVQEKKNMTNLFYSGPPVIDTNVL